MKSKEEIRKWLLENCVDAEGDLDLMYLDFSDFKGNVDISYMKVKGDLYQHNQEIKGSLIQDRQQVEGDVSELIERNIPMKVIKDTVINGVCLDYKCPHCKERIDNNAYSKDQYYLIRHCISCGQRLDWSK